MQDLINQIGRQEDWSAFITTVEMRDYPFLDWLPVGSKPVNPLYDYLADRYRAPEANSHVDGEDWDKFRNAGDQRGRLKALIQWFDDGTAVSRLTQDVTNVKAVNDELAHDIPKKLKEMSGDAEASFLDTHDHREDDHVNGYLTRSVGSWVSSSAQALYPVPADFRTPAASIDTSVTTENEIRDLLESILAETKSKEELTGFVGITLKRLFSDFRHFIPSSASTQSSGVVYTVPFKDKTIVRAIDRYEGDGPPVNLVWSPYNRGLTGTAAQQKKRGYFLHRSKWELRWHTKPTVYRLPFAGGSYRASCEMVAMLVCKSPRGEGSCDVA